MKPENKFYTTEYNIFTPYYKSDFPQKIMDSSDLESLTLSNGEKNVSESPTHKPFSK